VVFDEYRSIDIVTIKNIHTVLFHTDDVFCGNVSGIRSWTQCANRWVKVFFLLLKKINCFFMNCLQC